MTLILETPIIILKKKRNKMMNSISILEVVEVLKPVNLQQLIKSQHLKQETYLIC
jgi:hypothetical protein